MQVIEDFMGDVVGVVATDEQAESYAVREAAVIRAQAAVLNLLLPDPAPVKNDSLKYQQFQSIN